PGHGDIFESVIRLAKNEDALVLEVVEMSALGRRHDFRKGRSIQSADACCKKGRAKLQSPSPKFQGNPKPSIAKSEMHHYFGVSALKFVGPWSLGFEAYYWFACLAPNLNLSYA